VLRLSQAVRASAAAAAAGGATAQEVPQQVQAAAVGVAAAAGGEQQQAVQRMGGAWIQPRYGICTVRSQEEGVLHITDSSSGVVTIATLSPPSGISITYGSTAYRGVVNDSATVIVWTNQHTGKVTRWTRP
jgi:hypothetical protein